MISKYGCCCFPTLKDTKKKRRRRREGDQDEGRVKRRDGDKCRGKMLTNGRRTKSRKHRSKRCRRGNSKWKREKGEWEPQHFSYWLLLPSYPLLDMNISMKVCMKILYGSSSFFKFLSENYMQVYKTHKLCWITACNNLGYSHDWQSVNDTWIIIIVSS